MPPSFRVYNAVEGTLYWTGVASAYGRLAVEPGASILTYHSVLSPQEEPWVDPSNAVTARQFEAQMRFLAKHRRVVSMSSLVSDLEHHRPIRRRTVAITFDDGYLDVLEVAAPILSRLGLPAIVYLSTSWNDEGGTVWVDRLYSAFRHRTRNSVSVSQVPSASGTLVNGRALKAYNALNHELISMTASARDATVRDVERQLAPSGSAPRLIMTWDHVRDLIRRYPNIELGAHTVDHVDLTLCSDEEVRRQIEGSIQSLEQRLGVRPVHFSFPFDRSNERTRSIAAACGLRSAVGSGGEGLVRSGMDRFALPRITTTSSVSRLRFTTCGAYPELSNLLLRRR